MKNWYSGYNFHPVGQGLFTSGVLKIEGSEPYWWVFDCGTYLRMHHPDLTSEINKLLNVVAHSRSNGKPRVDLVFISHFDRDHICGLLELLRKFEVGRLVLPYVPLHKRIRIALEIRTGSFSDWQLFLIDPVRYIASAAGINVERIAVVLPSTSETLGDSPNDLPIPSDDGVFIEPPPSRRPIIVEEDYVAGSYPVEWLSPSARFNIKGLWEFVPYNDSSLEQNASRPFQKIIRKLSSTLLDPEYLGSRDAVKASMERVYDKVFGATPRLRNLISLFVYAGAMNCGSETQYAYCTSNELSSSDWDYLNNSHWPYYRFWLSPRAKLDSTKSLLLTGDGSLKTARQLKKLVDYLGQSRIDCVKVFQVMHHGAKTSWHENVARVIAPEYSVFCAFPFGPHPHPHPAVEFALRAHGPVHCRTGYGFSLWQTPY